MRAYINDGVFYTVSSEWAEPLANWLEQQQGRTSTLLGAEKSGGGALPWRISGLWFNPTTGTWVGDEYFWYG